MNDMYKNTWNMDLRKYYNREWSTDILDKARERMEKYHERIVKYITKYKTKDLIFENGAYNMNVTYVDMDKDYIMTIFLGDGFKVKIDLCDIIEDNLQMRYDRKCNSIYFIEK